MASYLPIPYASYIEISIIISKLYELRLHCQTASTCINKASS